MTEVVCWSEEWKHIQFILQPIKHIEVFLYLYAYSWWGPPPLCFMFFMAIGMCTISPIHWRDCGSCDLTLLSSIGCKNVSGFPAQYGNQLRRWVSRWGLSKKKVFFSFYLKRNNLTIQNPPTESFYRLPKDETHSAHFQIPLCFFILCNQESKLFKDKIGSLLFCRPFCLV